MGLSDGRNRFSFRTRGVKIGSVQFIRWFFNNGMYAFGVDTPAELMIKMKDYTMKDVIKNIKCHTLVIDSVADSLAPGQAKQFYDELECPKKLVVFDRASTAQAHCQMGASALSTAWCTPASRASASGTAWLSRPIDRVPA